MSRVNPLILTGVLALFICLYGGLSVLPGGLFMDSHEGDTYHFLDIVQRMMAGEVPHLDFLTPLGVLVFWPVVQFANFGFSIGTSMAYSQLALAALMLPILVYVGATRMSQWVAILFGCLTLGLILALSFGGASFGVTIAMHYNRWAWSVAFVVLALAFLPARGRPMPWIDGILIGIGLAALVLTKITFFVALLPAVAMALLARSSLAGLFGALIGGVVVAGAVTVPYGVAFWFAYLDDLRLVAASEVRPFVGVPFNEILVGPTHIAATLIGLAAVVLVRATQDDAIKTAIILLVPGLLYITYQNFGNDPQWLIIVAVLLLALRPLAGDGQIAGFDLRQTMTATAIAAFAVFFPSFFNLAMSPVEHLAFDKSRFVPMVPEDRWKTDLHIRIDRGYMITAQVNKDQEGGLWARYETLVDRAPEQEFEGITFPNCELFAGTRGYFDSFTEELQKDGVPAGSRIFTADILSAFWLFGPFKAPENGAPWYYGNLTGLENSDYLVIPKCGFVNRVRTIIIEELNASDFTFAQVSENELYALFAVTR